MLYSKGYIQMVKESGLLCKAKSELPDVWQKELGEKKFLICTKADLNVANPNLSTNVNKEIAISESVNDVEEDFDTVSHCANSGIVIFSEGNKDDSDKAVEENLIEYYGKGKMWEMTKDEYKSVKSSYATNPKNVIYPVMTKCDDILEMYKDICMGKLK